MPDRFTSQGRARLSAVLQASEDLVTIDAVMKTLAVDRQAAAKVLSRWQEQGWLKRVRRGLYAPIPLDASSTEQVLKDLWVLVPALFAPGYIGDGRRRSTGISLSSSSEASSCSPRAPSAPRNTRRRA